MKDQAFFERTKIPKLFLYAAIPGAIGMFASVIYQFVDAIFVSHALGPTAFAAVNLGFPFVIAAFAVSDMIAVGSSVLISIKMGRKEYSDANRLFTNAVLLILLVTVALGLFFGTSARWLIALMGAEGELLEMASSYLRIYSAFLPLTAYFFAFDNYLRICGKIKTSMTINLISSFLVIGLEAIFLFALRLPLWSSALAACLSFAFGALASSMPFLLGKLQLRFAKPHFEWKENWAIARNGFPSFLSNIAGRVTSVVFNTLLLSMGGEAAINAYGVLMYVDGFVLSILYGMCDSLQPAIGYNYGARKMDRVKKLGGLCFLASGLVCLVGLSACLLAPGPISSLFLNSSSVAEIGISEAALFVFGFSYLLRWVSYAGQSYSSALERPGASLLISVSHNTFFPLVLVGCLYTLGLDGIWLNFPLTSVGSAIVTGATFFFLIKKSGLFERPLTLEETADV